MRLEGKRIFTTAAGAGIGLSTVHAFIREGAHVTATDISPEACDALRADGIDARELDVTDSDAVRAMADDIGPVDVLFNCAGYVHHGTILDCDDTAFDFSVGLNIKGTYAVTQAFLPAMLEAGGGSIVSIASAVSSQIAAPNRFIYGTTKAAIIGLTKSVAADFVTQGVRANAICPATVESPSWEARVEAQGKEMGSIDAARDAFVARQPMGRIGKPEEIAALAVYLASDESAFVTGQAIIIDGGWTNV